jgi:general nucleoside transport system permease protein
MAILVAWLGGGRPLAIGLVALLYAGLLNGGFSLQVSGIPPAIGPILQAMLLLGVLVMVGLGRYRIRLVGTEGARA